MTASARRCAFLSISLLAVAACGGGGGSLPPPVPAFTIGGSVTGLTGSGLVLQDNGGDALAVTGNGSFRFAMALPQGAAFSVTVKSQPVNPTEVCSVSGGAGVVGSANITAIEVTCGAPQFAYVGGGHNIYVYALQGDGSLEHVQTEVNPATGYVPSNLAVTHSGQFLYSGIGGTIGDGGSSTITAYRLDPTSGAISTVAQVGFDIRLPALAIHPGDHFLYALGFAGEPGIYMSGEIGAFSINAQTGALTALAGFALNPLLYYPGLAIHPAGTFLYVPSSNTGQFSLLVFSIDQQTGALTALPGSTLTGSGPMPVALAFRPDGRYVYLQLESGSAGEIVAASIDSATGALSVLPGSVVIPPYPGQIVVTPSGRFLYSTSGSGVSGSPGSVSAFAINADTGGLPAVSSSPFQGLVNPYALAVDSQSRYLFVGAGDGVYVYDIDADTGGLSNRRGPFPASGPASIVVK